MARKPKVKLANSPWEPCLWEPADASAIQALFRGDANEAQQKRAINFIVNEICAVRYDPWNKDKILESHAVSKQSVGRRIVMLNLLNVSAFLEENTSD